MAWAPPRLSLDVSVLPVAHEVHAKVTEPDDAHLESKVDGAHVLESETAFWDLHEEVSVLGKGSYGTVKLSRVRSNGNLVAVKEVAKGTAMHDGSDIDEVQEAHVLSILSKGNAGTAPARIGGRRSSARSSRLSLVELQEAMRRVSESETAIDGDSTKASLAGASSTTSPATVLTTLPPTPSSPTPTPRHRPATVGPATADTINRSTQRSRSSRSGGALSVWQIQTALADAGPQVEVAVLPVSDGSGFGRLGSPMLSSPVGASLSPVPWAAEEAAADEAAEEGHSAVERADLERADSESYPPTLCPVPSGGTECTEGDEAEEAGDADGASDTVRLLDVYDTPSTLFLVMRAEMGGDLASRLASLPGGVCPEAEARTHAAALLRGLESAHAKRIVHRDIKPANVLLSEEGVGRVGDFGIAASLPEQGLLTAVCGTHNNMCPEMVRCGHGDSEGYGTAADMWQMGLLIFEMLCGTHPFARDTEVATLTAILDGTFSFPEGAPVSEPARDLLRRLLVSDPAERLTATQSLRHPWLCQS